VHANFVQQPAIGFHDYLAERVTAAQAIPIDGQKWRVTSRIPNNNSDIAIAQGMIVLAFCHWLHSVG
jgi:hypothetical protein